MKQVKELLQEMTLEEKANLCSGEDFWHTKAVERLEIPQVMVCDGPNGLRKQDDKADHMGINESIKAVCFPTSSAVAASFDRELAYHIGEVLGKECQAENISMLLGPGMNIKRSPLCGRNFEYYSKDPYLSGEMGTSYIKGIQSKKVGACVKHFAANNQETQRMNGNSVMDERTLHEIYLSGFKKAVCEAKPTGVMCAYNKINGTYAAENKELLTDVLRNAWGYEGFVVTDWGAVKDRVKGLEAGLDLEMPGSDSSKVNDRKIIKAVQEGRLSIEQLDRVAGNILKFVKNAVENKDGSAQFDLDADYKEAVEAAKECAVLLQNNYDVLPLKSDAKTAFIGGFIEKPRSQGSGSSHINSNFVPSIQEIIRDNDNIIYAKGFDLDSEENDETLIHEAVTYAKASDYAVIFAGLPNRYESEGVDRKHLNIPKNQNILISEVTKVQPNTIVVLFNGSPVEMPWKDDVAGILEMYLCGDGVSEAVMALLYGEANPSGKLAETFPIKLEDNPSYLNFPGENGTVEYHEGIFVGYRYYDKKQMDVLFPFGHGLSYTTFAYSDLHVSKEKLTETENVEVSITVTNTGSVFGKEVVQLYVGEKGSKVRRPEKELKRFEKVGLNPGENKTIIFTLDASDFAYYETRIHDFYTNSGEYEIYVGSSSRDIREQISLTIKAKKELPITISRETILGELMKSPGAQEIFSQIKLKTEMENADTDVDAMGEGSREMAEAMMVEMPLGSLVSFGLMSDEQLEGLIQMLSYSNDK